MCECVSVYVCWGRIISSLSPCDAHSGASKAPLPGEHLPEGAPKGTQGLPHRGLQLLWEKPGAGAGGGSSVKEEGQVLRVELADNSNCLFAPQGDSESLRTPLKMQRPGPCCLGPGRLCR